MDFDTAFHHLLGHEGSYSNHPSDPGGETMWGITIAVAREAFNATLPPAPTPAPTPEPVQEAAPEQSPADPVNPTE